MARRAVIVAWALDRTYAIALGFAVAVGSFVIAMVMLSWVYVRAAAGEAV